MNETDKEDFKCPICESTYLLTTSQSKTYSYGGRKFLITAVEATICSDCSFEFVLPKQRKNNEDRIRDAYQEEHDRALQSHVVRER